MRTTIVTAVLALCLAASGARTQVPAAPKLRVGVYDGRAIAVAYAPSRFNLVASKVAERDAAAKAGDKAKVRELEAWGERHQRQLHRQAFARVPVGDLLEPVKDGVASVARAKGLAAIAEAYTYTAEGVEVVDVTDALVQLYEPSAATVKTVAEVLERPPLDLDEVERGKDH